MNNFQVLHLKKLFESIVVRFSQFSGITLSPGVLVLVDLGLIDFPKNHRSFLLLQGLLVRALVHGLRP